VKFIIMQMEGRNYRKAWGKSEKELNKIKQ
jgi:hypothetical protein